MGICRCRKEELVVGFRMRERESAVVWRLLLRRVQSCGRYVGRDWYTGVDSSVMVSAFESELEGRESWAERRIIRSTKSSGNSTACLEAAGCEVRVRGLAGMGGGGERSRDEREDIRICDFAASILAVLRA